jgi:hypothetical protein
MYKELVIKQEHIFLEKLEKFQLIPFLNIIKNLLFKKGSMKLNKLILLPNLMMRKINKNILSFLELSERIND